VTVRRAADGAIMLEGSCPVEDAEPLLQMLLASPGSAVDWTACGSCHTAVVQVLVAAGVRPLGPNGDPWVARWLPELSAAGRAGAPAPDGNK
jgi:hypothetical protein